MLKEKTVALDGETEYVLQREMHNPTGLWVCPDPLAVVRHCRHRLPRRSALLDEPRGNDSGTLPQSAALLIPV